MDRLLTFLMAFDTFLSFAKVRCIATHLLLSLKFDHSVFGSRWRWYSNLRVVRSIT